MYRKVKELTDSDVRSRGIAAVMDRDGNLLTSMDDIKRRWKTYIEDLYNKQDKPTELDWRVKNKLWKMIYARRC